VHTEGRESDEEAVFSLSHASDLSNHESASNPGLA
jgi:hypothetical protein